MLTSQQLQCIELLAQGTKTQDEIAEDCNTSRQSIYLWRKDNKEFMEAVKKATAECQEITRQQFKASTAKAFQALNILLNNGSPKIKLEAAKEILNRGGFATETITRLELQPQQQEDHRLTPEQVRERLDARKILQLKGGEKNV